ncbi:F-box only protein 36a [Sparus aurata]|uniref:F-box only protein 36a n=1 Tax=Sparus aurata TaxID=8175 RepID=UPI0011C15C8B|nr:F-box only protein 36-like [Sparus aurata]
MLSTQCLFRCHGYSSASKIESLLGEHLLDLRGQSPPPTKDFFQLVITKTEVGAVFAQRILEHTILLCQGKSDYLERKPDVTSLKILSYTQLEASRGSNMAVKTRVR